MLKWVYEFNQEKLLSLQTEENKITAADVLILHSVVNSVCSVKMQTIFEDGKVYVWIDHSHLIEALPILNINTKRLSTLFKKYKTLGLIETKTIANHKLKGSKSFVALSDKLVDCLSDSLKKSHQQRIDQYSKMRSETQAVLKNEKSDNTLNSNNIELSKDNSNNSKSPKKDTSFLGSVGKSKSTKKITYKDCIDSIVSFTDDEKLREALVDYFNLRLSMMKDKPMRLVQWKTMLETLKVVHSKSSADVTMIDIVRRSIERGYSTFYPISNYSQGFKSSSYDIRKDKPWEKGVTSETYTEEEKREIDRQTAEREARGEQVWY